MIVKLFQLFNDRAATGEAQPACLSLFGEFRFFDCRVPVRQRIEVTDHLPNLIGGHV